MNRPNQVKRIFSVAWLTFLVLGVVCTLSCSSSRRSSRTRSTTWRPRRASALSPRAARLPDQRLPRLLPGPREYEAHHRRSGAGGARQGRGRARPGLVPQDLGRSLPLVSAGAIFGVTAGAPGRAGLHVRLQAAAITPPCPRDDEPRAARRYSTPCSKWHTHHPRLLRALAHKPRRFRPVHGPAPGRGRLFLRDAKVLYGVYGKAQTLYNLPAALLTPLTISVVPRSPPAA